MAFPDDFWWGTAASSTQTEGAAPRSDWYRWEREGRAPLSGEGNGFATRYADDFALLAEHALTHHRLSLEWARLEPSPGQHDPGAVEHYRDVLRTAKDAGIRIWCCLHHFTLPGWFSDDEGGFVDERARQYYWARHVDWVGETFGDLVFGWKPINEPIFYALMGYLIGTIPPGHASVTEFDAALEAIHLASIDAARLLHSGGQPVATIDGLMPIHPVTRTRDPNEREQANEMAEQFRARLWCGVRAMRDGILAVPGRKPIEVPEATTSFDFAGFSYYAALGLHADGSSTTYPADAEVGPMGYAPWPEGLGVVLRELAEELPGRRILVDECGLGTSRDPETGRDRGDDKRVTYLSECISHVERAIDDGIDVAGFFHWTAVDNYEWLHGYDVLFGLFDRDRNAKSSAAQAARFAGKGAAA
jgi:beta-glucosidase